MVCSASFSAGSGGSESSSGSTGGREILVQHLLVREDDLKLLPELQKRIMEGLFLVCVFFVGQSSFISPFIWHF